MQANGAWKLWGVLANLFCAVLYYLHFFLLMLPTTQRVMHRSRSQAQKVLSFGREPHHSMQGPPFPPIQTHSRQGDQNGGSGREANASVFLLCPEWL